MKYFPVNNNVIVSVIESYTSESWIEYKRDSYYDHMQNTEICCKLELVWSDSRLAWVELPMYFIAMKGELFQIDDNLYTIHEDRVKGLYTKPVFKNDFSKNMANVTSI